MVGAGVLVALLQKASQSVTCVSPPRTGVVLGGAVLADGWFHQTPLGWGLSLSLHFFGELSRLYHSYIIRGNRAIDKSKHNNKNRQMLNHVKIWTAAYNKIPRNPFQLLYLLNSTKNS